MTSEPCATYSGINIYRMWSFIKTSIYIIGMYLKIRYELLVVAVNYNERTRLGEFVACWMD
jgi:hypothetical protein